MSLFETAADYTTKWAGSTSGFASSFFIIFIWALCGPVFNYSDTWQLTVNTGTTIITFLMVFLIQRSQNKDMLSLHIKLDELIKAMEPASNRIILAETLSEEKLRELYEKYTEIAKKDNP
jgi:low affinity Fe/Cu permease